MAQTRSETRSDIEQRHRSERETTRGELTRRGPALNRNLGDPFAMMNVLHHEIDRMFDNFGFGRGLMPSPFFGRALERVESGDVERSLWAPQIEIYERDGKMHIAADLPGLDKKDVHVELNNDVLTIEGERRSEQRDEKGGWSERSYGRFFRSIPLPEGVNAENANAKFENGVLDISFDAPKRQEKLRGRQIEIK